MPEQVTEAEAKAAADEYWPYRRYNFERLADGNMWRLESGKDFDDLARVRAAAYEWARGNQLRCRTRRDGAALYVQFTVKESSDD